jgi:hypothetical protein
LTRYAEPVYEWHFIVTKRKTLAGAMSLCYLG